MATAIEKTAISDMGTMLFVLDDTSTKYKYAFPITAAPATGGAPSQIEVTELDSKNIQNILDRSATPAFEFSYKVIGGAKLCRWRQKGGGHLRRTQRAGAPGPFAGQKSRLLPRL